MKAVRQRKGFTLVEVVIAATIIVSIFSIMYGTYFAISSSSKTVRAKQKLSQQARDTMTRMARQIRCSYASKTASENKTGSKDKKKSDSNRVDYFYGNDDHRDETLHFVTTNSFFVLPQDSSEGLFDVTYKFDRNDGILYVSQERFVGAVKKAVKKQWIPIAENIQLLEMEFFDGQLWSDKWSYKDKQRLPSAVKIEIVFENQAGQIYKCSTAVNLYCGTNNEKGKLSSKVAVIKNSWL